ncbi:bone morphogenetic protein 15 [Halichoeres trimaculatus]|uniref:bone morphogenetic protein 15 n=1 Tax=Halichoeres trimaculatus TaxID=147232 RepID=UPI003D9F843B
MKATPYKLSFLRVCLLSSFIYLLCSTCTGHGVMPGSTAASRHPTLRRSRRSQHSARPKGGQHHRPLTDEQRADQNLQFMLSLYRSAAEPDGRPKQHRKFGSNTVRLLRPTASAVYHIPAPASTDHHYSFTVQYHLNTLPSEQLIRASFIHLRSSSSPSTQVLPPPRCRAQITTLGSKTLATLEPHEQWTETDITAHVQQRAHQDNRGHLTLTTLYWCTELDEGGALSRWWTQGRNRQPHVEAPSLLLYLEKGQEVRDWMGDLLGAEGEMVIRQKLPWHPPLRSRRHSKNAQSSEPKDPSLDALKNAPQSPSLSFSTSPSAVTIPEIPFYKHKTSMPKNRCKLHSFRLSFDELGWGHYFIAPPVYNPRFCKGNCPRVLHYGYHSPHHAIIQTAINDLGMGDVPPPSCVPYKYMPMSVLVMDKKKVEYRELEDMVAESCTCR